MAKQIFFCLNLKYHNFIFIISQLFAFTYHNRIFLYFSWHNVDFYTGFNGIRLLK